MKNNGKVIIVLMVICVLLSIGTLGITIYDRFFRNEILEPVILKPIDLNGLVNNDSCQCNCPNCSLGTTVDKLEEVKINNNNQILKLGNKEYKIRQDENSVLYINDEQVKRRGNLIHAQTAYLTNKFIFFTSIAQNGLVIEYAIDENNREIIVNNNNYQLYEISYKDNLLQAIGDEFCFDDCGSEKKLVIKYIDHTIIVTLAK